ncbi:MAG: hypothetical protein OXD50_16360 [Chloroflexi bacterium]|nr:hypothetical protein [Chloroflexota bacterium]
MKAKLNRLQIRDLVVFVVVAGIVAVSAVFAAREAGLGDGAVAESEPLTLTLAADERICETESAFEYWGVRLRTDADDNEVLERHSSGWVGVATASVRWRVSGGVEPYRLVVDGEAYRGQRGWGKVSCADASVERRWGTYDQKPERYFAVDPQVDSGWKTVRAVVTDANGQTAEATAKVYVLLSTGDWRHVFKGGETYRIFGRLMTVPEGVNLRIGEHSDEEIGPDTQSFWIEGTEATIFLNDDTYEEVGRWLPDEGARGAAEGVDLGVKLDELAESIGRLPDLRGQ